MDREFLTLLEFCRSRTLHEIDSLIILARETPKAKRTNLQLVLLKRPGYFRDLVRPRQGLYHISQNKFDFKWPSTLKGYVSCQTLEEAKEVTLDEYLERFALTNALVLVGQATNTKSELSQLIATVLCEKYQKRSFISSSSLTIISRLSNDSGVREGLACIILNDIGARSVKKWGKHNWRHFAKVYEDATLPAPWRDVWLPGGIPRICNVDPEFGDLYKASGVFVFHVDSGYALQKRPRPEREL